MATTDAEYEVPKVVRECSKVIESKGMFILLLSPLLSITFPCYVYAGLSTKGLYYVCGYAADVMDIREKYNKGIGPKGREKEGEEGGKKDGERWRGERKGWKREQRGEREGRETGWRDREGKERKRKEMEGKEREGKRGRGKRRGSDAWIKSRGGTIRAWPD